MKIKIFIMLFVTVLLAQSSVWALMSASAHMANFSGSSGTKSGYGAELSLPLLPLTLGASYLDHTFLSLPSFTGFSGGNMTGAIIPIYATFKFGVPLIPIFAAVEGGYTLATAAAGSATLAIPGGFYYAVNGGYSFSPIPALSIWAEAGYSFLVLDLRAAITSAGGSPGSIQNVDYSGASWKAGLTIGL